MLPRLKVGESPSAARSAALAHMDDDRAELAAESVEAVDSSASFFGVGLNGDTAPGQGRRDCRGFGRGRGRRRTVDAFARA